MNKKKRVEKQKRAVDQASAEAQELLRRQINKAMAVRDGLDVGRYAPHPAQEEEK